jgi:hypothetical protein
MPYAGGLIPYWAKDPKVAYKTINARAETVDTAPSYREAFKKRRQKPIELSCIVHESGIIAPRHIGLSINAPEAKPVCDGRQERDPQSEP